MLSVDCMAIPATSEHQEAAEMFINFMCETDIGKANAEYIGYTTPMESVREVLDEDLRDSEIAYPPEELAAKERVFTALSDDVNSELDVKWSEMKSYDEGGSSLLFLSLLAAWWRWPASTSGANCAKRAATSIKQTAPPSRICCCRRRWRERGF